MVAHHGKFVAYLPRLDRQAGDRRLRHRRTEKGRRGPLGRREGWQLAASFTEVESGRRKSRPELEKALAACKKHRAKLIVARPVDRLTRNTQFLLTLLNSGTEVIFCDLPQIPGAMGRMIVTMMAAIAEFEAGLIGERTKAGLKEAKRQGKEWGGAKSKIASDQTGGDGARAEALRPILTELADLPALTVARKFNRRKVERQRAANGTRCRSSGSASGSHERRRQHELVFYDGRRDRGHASPHGERRAPQQAAQLLDHLRRRARGSPAKWSPRLQRRFSC